MWFGGARGDDRIVKEQGAVVRLGIGLSPVIHGRREEMRRQIQIRDSISRYVVYRARALYPHSEGAYMLAVID